MTAADDEKPVAPLAGTPDDVLLAAVGSEAVDADRDEPIGTPDDVLLAEVDPEVAEAIDADRDELIGTPPDRLLLIEGGPGTGKTGTALLRVARLVEDGLDPAEVLVIGPTPAFARYSRALLAGWGFGGSEHVAIGELLPKAETGLEEPPHVTRLKGEGRMAGLLSRAWAARPRPDADELPSTVEVGDRTLTLDPATLRRVITMVKASEAPPDDRRRILRGALAGNAAILGSSPPDPRLVLAAADLLAERLWPAAEPAEDRPDPADFLRALFASPERLAAAADGEFTEREISALVRDPDEPLFSDADRPLLDEAAHLIDGDPRRYGHVLVDEAQDLSPMQLRAVSRRCATGSLTVVGDLAQSTGPWGRDDWHDVLAHLPPGLPREHRELRYAYRVPKKIFTLAAELLPTAAPSVQAPTVVREGPAHPVIVGVDAAGRAGTVADAAVHHAAAKRSVAVICPPRCRPEIEAALDDRGADWQPEPGAAITLAGPRDVKGLQFDAVIVVEPGLIVDDDPRGHRMLYIALTRATGHLHLVGLPDDLPIDLMPEPAAAEPATAAPTPAARVELDLDPAVRELIDVVANSLAETLITNLTPDLWPVALDRLAQLMKPLEMPEQESPGQ